MTEPAEVTIGKGRTLFQQGEKGGELYFIKAGQVELSVRNEAGEKAIVAVVGDRSVLGTMSFLEGDARSATATTISEVKVVIIKDAQRDKLLKTVPTWFAVLVKDLSSSLRRLNLEYAHLVAENASLQKRLAGYSKKHDPAKQESKEEWKEESKEETQPVPAAANPDPGELS